MGKIYASFDVEADGSIVCKNSMLSIGIVFFDNQGAELFAYQRNIKPLANREQEKRCMDEFWSKHPDVWDFVNTKQITAEEFVADLEYTLKLYHGHEIVWVANPAAYDWQWLKNYYDMFKSKDAPDIGYSARCLSTLFWGYCKVNGLNDEEKEALSEKLSAGYKLTHNPEDDARQQGHKFINLCKLMGIGL